MYLLCEHDIVLSNINKGELFGYIDENGEVGTVCRALSLL